MDGDSRRSRARSTANRILFGLRRQARATTSVSSGRASAVVSLTFDDALASQRVAVDLLDARGLRATFYVPSGSIGRKDHLDWDDIARFAEHGHEIGGHTTNHVHLPDLALEQARREIAEDRSALIAHGLDPVSFAYPFGESNNEVEALVREAGYQAARGIGGVVETVPAADAYRLRAPGSARIWTTSEHLAGLVLTAEHQQGWLIIPFHHVCEGGTSSYTTTPYDLAAFLDWLVERDVRVLPVRDVTCA